MYIGFVAFDVFRFSHMPVGCI